MRGWSQCRELIVGSARSVVCWGQSGTDKWSFRISPPESSLLTWPAHRPTDFDPSRLSSRFNGPIAAWLVERWGRQWTGGAGGVCSSKQAELRRANAPPFLPSQCFLLSRPKTAPFLSGQLKRPPTPGFVFSCGRPFGYWHESYHEPQAYLFVQYQSGNPCLDMAVSDCLHGSFKRAAAAFMWTSV